MKDLNEFIQLRELVEKNGLKIKYVASELGVTPQGLHNKLSGKTEFTHTEIRKLGELLGTSDVNRIFFAQKSELDSTKSKQ